MVSEGRKVFQCYRTFDLQLVPWNGPELLVLQDKPKVI